MEEQTLDYEPKGRTSHTTHVIGNCLYMWGGNMTDLPAVHDDDLKQVRTSFVEIFHLTTGKWERKHTTGTQPLGIRGYGSAVVGNQIIYFGGYCGHDDCYHNSVYSLCVDTFDWKELSPTSPHKGPMMKSHCGVLAVKFEGVNYLLVIGGKGSSRIVPQGAVAEYVKLRENLLTNEHHYFNLLTCEWTSPDVSDDGPPPCNSFTLTPLIANAFVMFGGNTPSNTPNGYCNTVYTGQCTKTTVNWQALPQPIYKSVNWPTGRCGHSTTVINGHYIILLSGIGPNSSDFWMFDTCKNTWKELTHPGLSLLTDRCYYSLSLYNVTRHTLWLIEFGGRKKTPPHEIISDTIVIELTCIDDGEWLISSVHRLNEYELKLHKRKTSTFSLQAKEKKIQTMDQLVGKAKESFKSCLQQELSKRQELEKQLQESRSRVEILNQQFQQSKEKGKKLQLHLQEALQQTKVQPQQEYSWVLRKEEIDITKDVVGEGAYGQVRVAVFRGLRVAAKCLHDLIISDYYMSTFAREMDIAAKIRHPNLVQFIGATKDATPIIIFELMPTNLHKELEKAPLRYAQIVNILQDVSLALNYLHLCRPPIIHRDVSSANVLLLPLSNLKWKAKLSDYGSANFMRQISPKSMAPGCPSYAAPEAVFPDCHSPAMDVYSFGILAMEMVLQEPPLSTTNEREHQADSIDDRSLGLKNLIKQCISKDYKSRPSIAYIFSLIEFM